MTIPEEKLREILALADDAHDFRRAREKLAYECSPDTVKAIVQELLEARAEIARTKKETQVATNYRRCDNKKICLLGEKHQGQCEWEEI